MIQLRIWGRIYSSITLVRTREEFDGNDGIDDFDGLMGWWVDGLLVWWFSLKGWSASGWDGL